MDRQKFESVLDFAIDREKEVVKFSKVKNFFKNKFLNYLLSFNLLAAPALAGNVTIDGHIFDKKGRNIEQVDVSYKRGESVLSSTTTDVSGYELFLTMNAVVDDTRVATDYSLKQNYPNPFNPMTTIEFSVLEPGVFTIYNLLGQEVAKKEFGTAGKHTATWGGANKNGEPVSSGIYIYVVKTGSKKETKKMTLLDGGRSGGLEISRESVPVFARLAKTADVVPDTLIVEGDNITDVYLPVTVTADTTIDAVVNKGPSFIKAISDTNVFVGDSIILNLNDYFDNDDASLFDSNLDCYWITIDDSILTMVPEFEGNTLIKILAVDGTDDELVSESNDFLLSAIYSNHAPVLNVPIQSVNEDSKPKHLLNLSDYVSDFEDDSVSFSLVSQSNPALVNVSLSVDSLYLTYLLPDGFGENIVGISSSDGELSDTAFFTLKVTPVADVTFKHVHFKTGEEIANNTFTLNDSVYSNVDSVKLQVDSDSLSLDVLNEDYWPHYFWVSRDSSAENIGQKDLLNSCKLALDSLDQTWYIHSIADTVDMYNIGIMIDGISPKGLDRFVTDTLTVWVDPISDTPNSVTLAYLEEITMSNNNDGIRYISNYDFATKFQYLGDEPTEPHICVFFDKGMPHPGSHAERVDFETNITQEAYLTFDTNVLKTSIMAEIRQTLHQRIDSPIGWGWGTADSLGRPIYSVKMHDLGVIAYNFEPGTIFYMPGLPPYNAKSTTATPAPLFESVYEK